MYAQLGEVDPTPDAPVEETMPEETLPEIVVTPRKLSPWFWVGAGLLLAVAIKRG